MCGFFVMSFSVTFAPTFLLYLGALVAGWAGGGTAVLIPLGLAFLLWHVVMRPAEWPRDFAAWTIGRAGRAVMVAGLLMALAGVSMLLGRGIALLLPPAQTVPAWVGVGMALLATPLQRLLHDPAEAARMAEFLDDALAQVQRPAPAVARVGAGDSTALRAALLAGETDLSTLARHHSPGAVLDALAALQDEDRLSRPLGLALISWACDPVSARELLGHEAPFVALTLVQEDAALLAAFARACLCLLRAEPEAFWDCPSNRMLRQVQQRHAGTDAAEALRALRIEQLCLTRRRLAQARAEWLALMQESADKPAS